jgi:hypothetical protein
MFQQKISAELFGMLLLFPQAKIGGTTYCKSNSILQISIGKYALPDGDLQPTVLTDMHRLRACLD